MTRTTGKQLLRIILALVFIGNAGISLAQNASPASTAIDFNSSNLPIVVIDTEGKTIVDEHKIQVHMGIIDNGVGKRNFITDPFNGYNGRINIEIRGSSTQSFPKKQYAFETQDSPGNNLNVSLLGLPPENDWILNDPYSDKSLIRNVLAYKIANDMGRYASRTRLCELVLNGEFWGTYVLMEKIKRDKNRVNIARMDSTDSAGADLTGGYIIKIDKLDGEDVGGWPSQFRPYPGSNKQIFYQYHYPKPRDILEPQKKYLRDYILDFEVLMYSKNYADLDSGYASVIDVASFVDYVIVNELSRNVDAYRLSAFMHKDRDDNGGKLVMGPIWDFNLAFGNADYYDAYKTYGWQLEYFAYSDYFHDRDNFLLPFWWLKLWQDPVFKNKVYQRWWSLRHDILDVENLLTTIDALVDSLNEAQKRNFVRWPVLGSYIWPNAYIGLTYEDEIDFMKDWLQDRIQWIDDNLVLDPMSVTEFDINQAALALEQNYPNPFNASTCIRYTLDKAEFVRLKIYNLLGQEVKTLVDTYQPPGAQSAVWHGRDNQERLVPSGIYTYRLETAGDINHRKMVFVR